MKELNNKQQENLDFILAYFNDKHPKKYKAGAVEHDSILSEFSEDDLLESALEEVLDLMSYLVTLLQVKKANKEDRW